MGFMNGAEVCLCACPSPHIGTREGNFRVPRAGCPGQLARGVMLGQTEPTLGGRDP